MKRSVKTLITVIITIIIAAFAWPYVKMEFAGSAYYTQNDEKAYAFYTPDLLKRMPRISDRYTFQYMNISGPQAFVYGIRFEDTTDMQKIREYLAAAGYKPQMRCETKAECWRSGQSKDVVTLYNTTSPNNVVVQIYRNTKK